MGGLIGGEAKKKLAQHAAKRPFHLRGMCCTSSEYAWQCLR